MNPNHPLTLAQLASSDHRFTTGTKGNPGRLILRDVLHHEITQFKHILRDPNNNIFGYLDPSWYDLTDQEFEQMVSKEYRARHRAVDLFVILKPGLDADLKPELEFKPKRLPHLINSGTVIGCIDFKMLEHEEDPSNRGCKIGIMIHHEANGRGFAKESLIAALDYILLGKPVLHNDNLCGLGIDKAFIETAENNAGLRGLMESLHLKHLEREGTPDHGQAGRMTVPSVTYTVTRAAWLEARKHVTIEWKPAGHQTLSRDGSPNPQELQQRELIPATGFGQASGPGHASSSKHIPDVDLRTGGSRFAFGGHYK